MASNKVITTKKARPKIGQSPQARWSRKQAAAGKCRACGKKRQAGLKSLCRTCQDKATAYMRRYRDNKERADE